MLTPFRVANQASAIAACHQNPYIYKATVEIQAYIGLRKWQLLTQSLGKY